MSVVFDLKKSLLECAASDRAFTLLQLDKWWDKHVVIIGGIINADRARGKAIPDLEQDIYKHKYYALKQSLLNGIEDAKLIHNEKFDIGYAMTENKYRILALK